MKPIPGDGGTYISLEFPDVCVAVDMQCESSIDVAVQKFLSGQGDTWLELVLFSGAQTWQLASRITGMTINTPASRERRWAHDHCVEQTKKSLYPGGD